MPKIGRLGRQYAAGRQTDFCHVTLTRVCGPNQSFKPFHQASMFRQPSIESQICTNLSSDFMCL